MKKSDEQLAKLAQNNLNIAYLGMESGHDEVLKKVVKGNTNQEMIDSSLRLKENGWKISVIAMLGLGGRELSEGHCKATAESVSIRRGPFQRSKETCFHT